MKPVTTNYSKSLVWFRRDLRATDHAALYHALKSSDQVYCVFIFDREIIDALPADDARVAFIHASALELNEALQGLGGELIVRHALASDEIPQLAASLGVQAVFTNHDYEPAANLRDAKVSLALMNHGIEFHTFKDQVIFERSEVLTQSDKPYGVFTPYKNAWLKKIDAFYLKAYPVEAYANRLAKSNPKNTILPLEQMSFREDIVANSNLLTGVSGAKRLLRDFLQRMDNYKTARDFPAVKGPSYLSVHLRFGTVSIRELAREAYARAARSDGAATWLSELIWRDFYFQILHHHPHVATRAFKPEYDRIVWRNDKAQFKAWCEARTGYPLVDAAMRQLNQTGYMHNRLRMVTASFLIKDLGIDWRWGEAYFAQKLIDFDLSANNGGWQWAASSGCDAQPYFRIFNPLSQSEKFDPQGKFIRRYLPELAALNDKDIHAPWLARPMDLQAAGVKLGDNYPLPIVQHDQARAETLARYAVVKK
jgi:deoxyribodipyrimidine photo-lyase